VVGFLARNVGEGASENRGRPREAGGREKRGERTSTKVKTIGNENQMEKSEI